MILSEASRSEGISVTSATAPLRNEARMSLPALFRVTVVIEGSVSVVGKGRGR